MQKRLRYFSTLGCGTFFQDGKTHCDMGEYQVRGWYGWHHRYRHMAMVLMAMLFLLRERLDHNEFLNLLSCTDIVESFRLFPPRRDVTEKEVLKQLRVRHAKRQASIDYAYKKTTGEQVVRKYYSLTK